MDRRRLLTGARAAKARGERRASAPLAFSRLWDVPAPRASSQRGAGRQVAGCTAFAMLGGNGCLRGDTPIYDPVADSWTPISELRGWFHVEAWDGRRVIAAQAQAWPAKGPDPLLRVTLSNGQAFSATAAHRVLTPDGWRQVGTLTAGSRVLEAGGPSLDVLSVEPDGEHAHYDLHVPSVANYVAAGVVHHNSGKTDFATQLAVAAMLGSGNPIARRWLDANGLDLDTIPPYPGRVLLSALTSNDSRKVLREKVRRLLPPGCKWRNERGDGEAEVSAPGAVGNNGTIVFKSNDQGARAYQADEFDLIILDEEHDSPVMGECMMRLGRRPWKGCYILLSMTPLKGMTWVYDDFQASPKPGYRYAEIDGRDNPYLDQAGRAQRMARYGEHELAARQSGKFVALEGLVFSAWSRGIHVVPAFRPPAEWPRYAGIDFGTSNPFACGLFALDPADDVLHLIALHYRAGLRWEEHAVHLKAMFDEHGWPLTTWADPEEANGRMTLANLGIPCTAARKDIRPGINAVASRLSLDANGRPHFLVHDRPCNQPFVREIEGYVWAPRAGAKDSPDLPLKANDHCQDMNRYVCFGLERQSAWGASY